MSVGVETIPSPTHPDQVRRVSGVTGQFPHFPHLHPERDGHPEGPESSGVSRHRDNVHYIHVFFFATHRDRGWAGLGCGQDFKDEYPRLKRHSTGSR